MHVYIKDSRALRSNLESLVYTSSSEVSLHIYRMVWNESLNATTYSVVFFLEQCCVVMNPEDI